MRVHCLQRVNMVLGMLDDRKVHFENLGAADIVDGNVKLTLGFIWTIILFFQIQSTEESTQSSKESLLNWCKEMTADYPNIQIKNFTTSWCDGLAFNAIIHKHRPNLIQYENLRSENAKENLTNAFFVAESELAIAALLDVDDFMSMPDEKSIMTYLSTFQKYFRNNEKEKTLSSNQSENKKVEIPDPPVTLGLGKLKLGSQKYAEICSHCKQNLVSICFSKRIASIWIQFD